VSNGVYCGGGRYDDLNRYLWFKRMSVCRNLFWFGSYILGVGRIKGCFLKLLSKSLQVLCVNFGEKEALAALQFTPNCVKTKLRPMFIQVLAKNAKADEIWPIKRNGALMCTSIGEQNFVRK